MVKELNPVHIRTHALHTIDSIRLDPSNQGFVLNNVALFDYSVDILHVLNSGLQDLTAKSLTFLVKLVLPTVSGGRFKRVTTIRG